MKYGPGSTARHVCHCGKSFIRKEHLTRHQASHDKLAYLCNVCQRQFSRRDMLRRHSVVHETSNARVVVSCDACRANKSKCSGGLQCLLCMRRGIECTFRRGSHRAKDLSTSDKSTAVTAFAGQNDDRGDNDSTLKADSESVNILGGNSLHTEGETLPPDVNLYLNLTIVPSASTRASEFRPLSFGIEAIHEFLIAKSPSLEGSLQEWDESQEWLDRYRRTYLNNFHLQWPILHAPTFDVQSASLPLAASVCIIGAWFQGSATWTERLYALKVHDILLSRILHRLIDPESIPDGRGWPIELFQAVLLTLIFSFYRTDAAALSRATHLRSAYITTLRRLGAFNADLLGRHLETYYSGPYGPYTMSMRERFKRLSVYTYQFDTYYALARQVPPALHRQEIGITLPSTFMLWNTYGLDILATRQPEEPPGRALIPVSTMTSHPDSVMQSAQLLVEDVQLGLCGLLQAIWVSRQLPSDTMETNRISASQRPIIAETLDAWKHELDKIHELAALDKISSHAAKYLYLAYRGQDGSVAASLGRIAALVQDGMVLYYFLRLVHYSGLSVAASSAAAVGLGLRPAHGLESSNMDDQAQASRTTVIINNSGNKDEREALACALQLLMMVDTTAPVSSSSVRLQSLNPLIHHALALGVNVMRAILSSQRCECASPPSQPDDARAQQQQAAATYPYEDNSLQRWVETGAGGHRGSPWLDGAPVCACRLEWWMGRFHAAIRDRQSLLLEEPRVDIIIPS